MPHIPSNYSIPSISVTSYGKLSSLNNSSTSTYYGSTNPYSLNRPTSSLSPTTSSYAGSNSSYSFDDDGPLHSRLPPPIPASQRRATPVRRAYTANLEGPRKTSGFQPRPLKNLTVVSRSPTRNITRSPSPSLSVTTVSSASCAPRRIFPQVGATVDLNDLDDREEAPVIFDANLTFVLGCKGKLRQNFKPVPAHLDQSTASSVLSNKIADFLQRTDHVMDEWKNLGHRDERDGVSDGRSLGRSKSATNIMIKGFQYFSRASSCRSSVTRDISEDATEALADEVNWGSSIDLVVALCEG